MIYFPTARMLSRQSSASNAEQQELEREVLQSIFAAEFSELPRDAVE
eukprot:COSAG02_NODE_34000_length_491_cov_0.737245_1_plen_46_part_10